MWKLSFPGYRGKNSGLPYAGQTYYFRRIPQYFGNAVSGGNNLCVWLSTEDPNDTSPVTDFRYILGHGLRYSQTVLGGETQLGWGILYYDAFRFLPFVGVTVYTPERKFRCLGRNEFIVRDEFFIDMPERLFVEPFWP